MGKFGSWFLGKLLLHGVVAEPGLCHGMQTEMGTHNRNPQPQNSRCWGQHARTQLRGGHRGAGSLGAVQAPALGPGKAAVHLKTRGEAPGCSTSFPSGPSLSSQLGLSSKVEDKKFTGRKQTSPCKPSCPLHIPHGGCQDPPHAFLVKASPKTQLLTPAKTGCARIPGQALPEAGGKRQHWGRHGDFLSWCARGYGITLGKSCATSVWIQPPKHSVLGAQWMEGALAPSPPQHGHPSPVLGCSGMFWDGMSGM